MKRGTIRHPKLYDLMQALEIKSRPLAVGYLEMLWHFTDEFAPQGDIGRYSDARIEGALDWSGKRGRLIEAFTTSGWVDVHNQCRLVVHDWHDHATDATRKKLQRAGLQFLSVTEKMTGQCPPSVPDNGGRCPTALPIPAPTPKPAPVQGAAAEWPETATAVRGYFPATDDALVVVIAQNAMRSYADVVNGHGKSPPLTDAIIAEAVHEAHFKKQTSAGLFADKVPRVVKSWAEEAIRNGSIH